MIKKLFVIFFIVTSIIYAESCSVNSNLQGKYFSQFHYEGKHVGTTYIEFYPDSSMYEYVSKSHFSSRVSRGRYERKGNIIILTSNVNINKLPLYVEQLKNQISTGNLFVINTSSENNDTVNLKFQLEFNDTSQREFQNFKSDSLLINEQVSKFRIKIIYNSDLTKLYRLNSVMYTDYYRASETHNNIFKITLSLDNKYFDEENINSDTLTVNQPEEIYFHKFNLRFYKKKPPEAIFY